ncbi:hypothetical protein BaRGS_00035831 [Batillaria attramentaria]|uniref:C2H2-type domain-containing protein n=1 Tax=Batillaria attramentaria TaxID=370345 RepID=A0ABD0JBZ7_9CAEN
MNAEPEMTWNYGQRIVDLSELAKQMQCQACSLQLDLNRTQSESRFGLASVLVIACPCGVLNNVHTSKGTKSEKGTIVYAVNAQLAACTLEYGLEMGKLKKLLAGLRIPFADDSFSDVLCILDHFTQNVPAFPSGSMGEHQQSCQQSPLTETFTYVSHPHVAPTGSFTDPGFQHHQMLDNLPLQQQACEHVVDRSLVKEERCEEPVSEISQFPGMSWPGTQSETNKSPSICNDSDQEDKSELWYRSDNDSPPTRELRQSQCRQSSTGSKYDRVHADVKKKKTLRKKTPSESPACRPSKSVSGDLMSTVASLDRLVSDVPQPMPKRRKQRQDNTECLLMMHFSLAAKLEHDKTGVDNNMCSADSDEKSDSRNCETGKQGRKVCDVCGMYLSNRSALTRHQRLKHQMGEPLVCPTPGCGKKFARQELLDSHINCIHSDSKPFQCSRCGKQFGCKKYMLDHMARCGRQPYKCDACNMAFRDRAARRDHISKYHEGQQFFTCQCGKVYGWRSSLLKHQKKCCASLQ